MVKAEAVGSKGVGKTRKLFVVKILISNSFEIKILAHLFCETRVGQGFQRYRGAILRDNTFPSQTELSQSA
jgi:hypothetical protein